VPDVRAIALAFLGVAILACYGTPAVKPPSGDGGSGGGPNLDGGVGSGGLAGSQNGGRGGVAGTGGGASSQGGASGIGGLGTAGRGGTGGTTGAAGLGGSSGAGGGGGAGIGGSAGIGGATGCTPTKLFGAPLQIIQSGLNTQESSASISVDGLSAIVAVTSPQNPAYYLLKAYSRTSLVATFQNPEDLSAADFTSATPSAYDPRLSRDGLLLFFDGFNGNSGLVFLSTRSDRSSPFETPSALSGTTVNVGQNNQYPWISSDNTQFYYTRDGLLYSATLSGGAFTNVGPVDEVNANGSLVGPVLTDDQLALYFSANWGIGGAAPPGYFRVWKATRSSKLVTWSNPTLVTELDTGSTNIFTTDVSPDGCILYLDASTAGFAHIYQATKPH
jgi:hypothetical protein